MCSKSLPTLVWTQVLLLLLTLQILLISGVKLSAPDSARQCEPIRIDMCRGLGYNVTGMPNMVGHELQQDAELQLQTFTPLIQYGCSSQLRFFLCAVYTPMCTDKVPISIGPCRPLCENVRHRCEPVLQEFGFPWPSALNCSKFPLENNHQHMCMEGPEPEHHERLPQHKYPTAHSIPAGGGGGGGGRGGHSGRRNKPNKHHKPSQTAVPDGQFSRGGTGSGGQPSIVSVANGGHSLSVDTTRKHHYNLCLDYKYFDQYYYINRTERCAHNCSADILFTSENKNFADLWTAIWAVMCFVSTLFTISTFLVDSTRFRYPERAVIFLAANYCIYSCAYIYRLIAGRQDVACHVDSQHNVSILIQEGLDNVNCTVIFVLLYFFGMASAVWWLILAFTWFLAAGLRWSPAAIDSKYTYYHFIAWILPALKTIAILVMRVVDADELTGTCYVGQQSRSTLLYFVIIPSAVYLALGVLFLLGGLCAKLYANDQPICHTCIIPTRVRHGSHHSTITSSSHSTTCPHPLLSQSQTAGAVNSCYKGSTTGTAATTANPYNSEKLNVLMVRVGIFALIYTLPATSVLGANIYEYWARDSWYLMSAGAIHDRPNVEIFTLKIFMSLVIGIKTGLWMWSSKTPFTTWRKVGKRLVQKKQPLPLYLQGVNGPGIVAAHKQALIPVMTSNGQVGANGKRTRVKGAGGNETAV
ncbi:unnamed protein product [Oppiella nova]|uniref:Frizzled-4 n=1 Tax=Oppiella nova TaxID=334625 RepID=A0A7R9QFB0_9ACAR|nr:unnamed protein product [Oppiella nova]CAG2164779.1 unnamed protein product [Oppiella nova]